MIEHEIWFSRLEDKLFFAVSRNGEPPGRPKRVQNAAVVLQEAKKKRLNVTQVGIVPPDMLGLS